MSDTQLAEIVSTPFSTIEEVILIMQRIDALLPNEDGLKWFNFLYLKVTEAVLANPPAGGWSSPGWLSRLDVVFAGLYFEAVRKWLNNPGSAPTPWRILLDARHNQHIFRVQFALCGMNAHINRDLQFALVQTGQELNIKPRDNSPEHRDFIHVNSILEVVEAEVLPIIATGIVGTIEQSLGRLDNILGLWAVRRARDTAWLNARFIWPARNNQTLMKIKMEISDGLTGFAGRALIIPVG